MASQHGSPLRVGQALEITFPCFTPRITVRSERELTVEIVAGDNLGFSDTVDYEAITVRDGLVVLSWREHIGSTIVHVLDLVSGEAYTAVTRADGGFMRLRGRIYERPHAPRASKHDFDFMHGSWTVHNRYLKSRLKGSSEWIEFEARSDVEPLLDGFGQIDRYSAMRDGSRVEGVTLRLFNPATGEWSLHWADTVRPGELLPPMVGRFKGDVGEFFGDEMADGKRVLCRFHWTRTADGLPRWEQAFSDDGGRTWETNWVMTFTRR
jgi:MoaF-like